MGIVLVRVDDRLVHGQIIEAWVPFCRATAIIVANDEAAGSRIQKMAIESCASKSVSIKVETIKDAAGDIISPRMENENVIVIVSNLRDIVRLHSWGIKFSSVNIGNIHHNGERHGIEYMKLSPSIFIDRDDWGFIIRFREEGIKLDIRTVPMDSPVQVDRWKDK